MVFDCLLLLHRSGRGCIQPGRESSLEFDFHAGFNAPIVILLGLQSDGPKTRVIQHYTVQNAQTRLVDEIAFMWSRSDLSLFVRRAIWMSSHGNGGSSTRKTVPGDTT